MRPIHGEPRRRRNPFKQTRHDPRLTDLTATTIPDLRLTDLTTTTIIDSRLTDLATAVVAMHT